MYVLAGNKIRATIFDGKRIDRNYESLVGKSKQAMETSIAWLIILLNKVN